MQSHTTSGRSTRREADRLSKVQDLSAITSSTVCAACFRAFNDDSEDSSYGDATGNRTGTTSICPDSGIHYTYFASSRTDGEVAHPPSGLPLGAAPLLPVLLFSSFF
jgi:hypothetical protein